MPKIGDRGAERRLADTDADDQAQSERGCLPRRWPRFGRLGEFLVEMKRLRVHRQGAEQHVVHFGDGAADQRARRSHLSSNSSKYSPAIVPPGCRSDAAPHRLIPQATVINAIFPAHPEARCAISSSPAAAGVNCDKEPGKRRRQSLLPQLMVKILLQVANPLDRRH